MQDLRDMQTAFLATIGESLNWSSLAGKPSAFAPSAHTHPISDVLTLQAALDGKAPASHVTDTGNPHAVTRAQVGLGNVDNTSDAAKPISTATQAALDGKSAVGHTHAYADITGKPATFPPFAHTHAIADVTGLQTALDGKAAISHTHTIGSVIGLQTALDALVTQRAVLTYAGADLTWTYPVPYAAGVVPVIGAVVAGTSTAMLNVQIVGDPTNTSCKFRVNSIAAASVSLVGLLSLTLFSQAASGVKIHATARLP